MKGFEVIQPFYKLEMMAYDLGIDSDSLENTIIPSMEQLNFIRIHKNGMGNIERIEENIPSFNKLLDTSAKYWQELDPYEIEIAGLRTLNLTSVSPVPLNTLESKMNLNKNNFEIMLDSIKAGKLLGEYTTSSGEKIIYSPTI